jgi:hypothetical protein
MRPSSFLFGIAAVTIFVSSALAEEHPCVHPKDAFATALCSDPDLRAIADQQLPAMMAFWNRLSPQEQEKFRSDQLAWRDITARRCRVDRPTPLPLSAETKICLNQAEAGRIAYLQHYGQTDAPATLHPNALPQVTSPASVAVTGEHGAAAYQDGLRDRAAWEQWFNGLQGDYKTGAFFWASQRSLPNPGTCKQMSDDFYAGCTAAKTKLASSDALRKTEPDYKAGWNTWTADATPPAPTPAPTPATENAVKAKAEAERAAGAASYARDQALAATEKAAKAKDEAEREREIRDKAIRDAVETARDQEQKMVASDLENGYPTISFEDFALDGKEFAKSGKKIALAGVYVKRGDIEWIFSTPMTAMISQRSIANGTGATLLTDNASRGLRSYFLQCSQDPATSSMGCQARVRGTVQMCDLTTSLSTREVPCLVVEGGWSWPGHSSAAPLASGRTLTSETNKPTPSGGPR